jgi:LysR family transcriptional regulator, regulator of abg operon
MVVIFATLGLPICAGRRSARTDWLSLEPSVVTRYRLFGGEFVSTAIAERPPESSVCVLQRASITCCPAQSD